MQRCFPGIIVLPFLPGEARGRNYDSSFAQDSQTLWRGLSGVLAVLKDFSPRMNAMYEIPLFRRETQGLLIGARVRLGRREV
jgi:hypothetical protein